VVNLKSIYIAGPSVFREDAIEYGNKLKELCLKYGFIGLYPLDNEFTESNDIALGNYDLIDKCDIVIADCTPFRSNSEMDSGTACEIGYAYAKGKKIIVFSENNKTMLEKVGCKKDENGLNVEDFDEVTNIMISTVSDYVNGNFEDALISLL
jgi:nucleoside 2-deoxyribosyltransferase